MSKSIKDYKNVAFYTYKFGILPSKVLIIGVFFVPLHYKKKDM